MNPDATALNGTKTVNTNENAVRRGAAWRRQALETSSRERSLLKVRAASEDRRLSSDCHSHTKNHQQHQQVPYWRVQKKRNNVALEETENFHRGGANPTDSRSIDGEIRRRFGSEMDLLSRIRWP